MDIEKSPFPTMKEQYVQAYGIHRWQMNDGSTLTGISAPTWLEFIQQLKATTPSDKLIVGPELITGAQVDEPADIRQLIEARVKEVQAISKQRPEATILLGTAAYEKGDKPTNSVLYLQAGKVVGKTNKRTYATQWEKDTFRFLPEEPASLIPGTNIGVLICADLPLSTLYLSGYPIEQVLRLSGRRHLIGLSPQFFHPDCKSIVVLSCWGIGSNSLSQNISDPDRYYWLNLKNISLDVLRNVSYLKQIVFVDRAPLGISDGLVTSKPINASIQKTI